RLSWSLLGGLDYRTALFRIVRVAILFERVRARLGPIVLQLVGMRLNEDFRIGPGECHREFLAAFQQTETLREMRGRADSAAAWRAACYEPDRIDHQRVGFPMSDRMPGRRTVQQVLRRVRPSIQVNVPGERLDF